MPGSQQRARWSNLAAALAWRLRREGVRYLLAAFIPFAAVLGFLSVLPMLAGGRVVNGRATDAAFGLSYGAHANPIAVGLLLIITPGLVALFSAIGVARMVRGLIGAEVSRGGIESLLSAPYALRSIAAALYACFMTVAAGFWAVMSALGTLDVALVAVLSGDHLSLSGSYLALAFGLPLMSSVAGTGVALLVSLLFPRLTQLGATINVAGGDLGSGAAVLPGFAVLLALVYGAASLGPARLLLIGGGTAALIVVVTVLAAARGFRPEAVLES